MDWNAIVRDHAPDVFRAAWRILGHAADAEDVTQEVFLEAFQLRRSQSVRNWPALLRRMAVCRALDRLRRRRPAVPLDSIAVSAGGASAESEAIAAELAERLSEAIGQLPSREAEVFCLCYFEDCSNRQIADVLGIATGAVAAALCKARSKLQVALHSHLQGETI